MNQTALQTSKETVDRRFHAVSLEHPINAMLYDLALKREERRANPGDSPKCMHVSVPNMEEYIDLRKKMSLLPLDTIRERIKLPVMPGAILQLQRAIEEDASAERMAKIILTDPKLTVSIMSMVNSPLYALPTKVETLSRALAVIGTRQISILALATRLLTMFDESTPSGMPLTTFWKHSIACAVLSNDLAILSRRPEPEKFLMAGLLHDLGRVILFSQYPDQAKAVFAIQQVKGIPLQKAELWMFDVDHAMIGALFFNEWGLPDGIKLSALYHHDAAACVGKDVPEVVYAANQIATALGIGCNTVYAMDPGKAVWERLNIQDSDLISMVETVDERLWAMFNSLFSSSSACKRQ